jgi:hypothetical protein
VATKAERLRSRDPGAEGGRHVGYPTLGSDRVRGYIALVKYLECIKKQRQGAGRPTDIQPYGGAQSGNG